MIRSCSNAVFLSLVLVFITGLIQLNLHSCQSMLLMTPVAQATNILQAEANVQMGWLLPTIKLLKIKLNRIKLPLKYCKPLVNALQVGIGDRFGPMMEDPELVGAAILEFRFSAQA